MKFYRLPFKSKIDKNEHRVLRRNVGSNPLVDDATTFLCVKKRRIVNLKMKFHSN